MNLRLRSTAPASRAQLSSRLRFAIQELGLTQAQAGARLRVEARQVRRWLNGGVSIATWELVEALELELAQRQAERVA
jgi:transcriptional regulator with XRE-family HTH domain